MEQRQSWPGCSHTKFGVGFVLKQDVHVVSCPKGTGCVIMGFISCGADGSFIPRISVQGTGLRTGPQGQPAAEGKACNLPVILSLLSCFLRNAQVPMLSVEGGALGLLLSLFEGEIPLWGWVT